ncbi:CbtA family protein [Nocardia zapadnayensis]|uniref:CbtA family protein n=1 Tax=Nocardia rhamnosiphila TaxID=426716 RepID=UPI0022487460|nr:CbtA family protein [Nocardia zapadnayensis]MCX0269951.1 CbtA family protein [Nocardia zapadnayensis]
MPLSGSFGALLLRGLLAGLIAGLLAGVVGNFVGEPRVEAAIAIEEAAAPAPEHAHDSGTGHTHGETAHAHGDDAVVSRPWQKFGQFLAAALAGMAFGAIVATAAHYARRFTALPGHRLVLGLGLAGWVAVVAVPFFEYPANPPAVGDPETINERTLLWVAAVLVGMVAVAAGVSIWKALRTRPESLRLVAVAVGFVLVVTLGYTVLPEIDEVGADFPASLLWEFRAASLAVSTTLWVGIGLAFAALTEWSTRGSTPVPEAAATAG